MTPHEKSKLSDPRSHALQMLQALRGLLTSGEVIDKPVVIGTFLSLCEGVLLGRELLGAREQVADSEHLEAIDLYERYRDILGERETLFFFTGLRRVLERMNDGVVVTFGQNLCLTDGPEVVRVGLGDLIDLAERDLTFEL